MRKITILNYLGLSSFHKHRFRAIKQKHRKGDLVPLYKVCCPICELTMSVDNIYKDAVDKSDVANKTMWTK